MAQDKCGIVGCDKAAERSSSKDMCDKAGLRSANEDAKRVHLCKEHYKQMKKATKTDRKLDMLGR